jgi:SAM-dependent methyltransferase
MNLSTFVRKIRYRVLPNLKYLPQSRFRHCQCCLKPSLIISFSNSEEFKLCIRCRANLRYEMLAMMLRKHCPDLGALSDKVIVELDPNSPLPMQFEGGINYIKTYYSTSVPVGFVNADGLRCEDLMQTSFDDASVDVIISSDVLEHVPDIEAAFKETKRILKPGGFHIFTVPPRSKTTKRAEIVEGKTKLLMEPDYHSDPLNPKGILAYWDFGVDAIELFSKSGLDVSIIDGPKGKSGRLVWMAKKTI